jgi:hypothetical protein
LYQKETANLRDANVISVTTIPQGRLNPRHDDPGGRDHLIASEATATGDRRGAAICRTCFHPRDGR